MTSRRLAAITRDDDDDDDDDEVKVQTGRFMSVYSTADRRGLPNVTHSTYISYDWTSQKVISLYVPHRQ